MALRRPEVLEERIILMFKASYVKFVFALLLIFFEHCAVPLLIDMYRGGGTDFV